jgi:hypothetical protein
MLLVGPTGAKSILMSDAGGSYDLAGYSFAFANQALQGWEPVCDECYLGSTYERKTPADYNGVASDVFPAPAPAGPYTADLTVFNGTDPNGTWSLYIVDDTVGDVGEILDGWSLTFEVTAGCPGMPTFTPRPPTATKTAVITSTATSTATATETTTFTPTATDTATATVTPSGPPDFSISVTPSSRTVVRPGSVSYNVVLTSLNGFSGNVALSVSGLPVQTAGSYSPQTVFIPSGGTGTSTLTVTASRGGPRGTFTLNVTGASGALKHSQNVTLEVTR